MRKWCALLAAMLLAGQATAAERQVICHVKEVMHTRYGVLVNCSEKFTDKGAFVTETIDWFAPDARLLPNANKLKPQLTVGETMAGFEAVALEALRSKGAMVVGFGEGERPGGLFDCLNQNCRLARFWSLRQ